MSQRIWLQLYSVTRPPTRGTLWEKTSTHLQAMSHRLFVLAALSLAAAAFAGRATAIEPDYPCYMRSASGQLMNLGALCTGPIGAGSIASPQLRSRTSSSKTPFPATSANSPIAREGREARKGDGEYFNYEVLSDQANRSFRLKYWSENSSPSTTYQKFKTAQEAVDYFECAIVDKDTAACPGKVFPNRIDNRPTSTSRSTATFNRPASR